MGHTCWSPLAVTLGKTFWLQWRPSQATAAPRGTLVPPVSSGADGVVARPCFARSSLERSLRSRRRPSSSLRGALGLPEEALELRGYVGDDELAGLYQFADLALVPSIVEGFSIPVAEAVLRGTPAVASDISSHRELIGAGPWLAPATDVDALAEAIGHVCAHRAAVVDEQRTVLGDTADPGMVMDRVAAALEPLLLRGHRPSGRAMPPTVRPRVAVVTPFPPQRSGVADYTAYTFRQVANYADVEVYTSASPDASESATDQPALIGSVPR